MFRLPQSIENVVNELQLLPGIGPKTASRLAFYMLRESANLNLSLGKALTNMKNGISFCPQCYGIAEDSYCSICNDSTRDKSIICIVEEVLDMVCLEETHIYKGLYHVLHGHLSPIDGVGPNDLKINELSKRLTKIFEDGGAVNEVILATNAGIEGEATANYISQVLKPFDLKITRLARGIPTGGNLEYIDSLTLQRAMEGRINF